MQLLAGYNWPYCSHIAIAVGRRVVKCKISQQFRGDCLETDFSVITKLTIEVFFVDWYNPLGHPKYCHAFFCFDYWNKSSERLYSDNRTIFGRSGEGGSSSGIANFPRSISLSLKIIFFCLGLRWKVLLRFSCSETKQLICFLKCSIERS